MYEMLVGPERFRQHRSSSSSQSDSQPSGGAKPTPKPTSSVAHLPPPRKVESRIPRSLILTTPIVTWEVVPPESKMGDVSLNPFFTHRRFFHVKRDQCFRQLVAPA
jgi:hypothetical protein